MSKTGKARVLRRSRLALCMALLLGALCGCAGAGGQNAATGKEPTTLEQALLKERGIAYDQSDYKKFLGGEGIIDEYAEFDCAVDHSYSTDINTIENKK